MYTDWFEIIELIKMRLTCSFYFLSVSSADRLGFRSDEDNASTNPAGVEDCVILMEKAFWMFGLVAD